MSVETENRKPLAKADAGRVEPEIAEPRLGERGNGGYEDFEVDLDRLEIDFCEHLESETPDCAYSG